MGRSLEHTDRRSVPVGYGSRMAVNSSCDTPAAPGYNSGSSNGYIPGSPSSSTCTGQTRDVQEITGGYWYDIYKGDHGRLRQSIQYGYAVREGWSGAGSPALAPRALRTCSGPPSVTTSHNPSEPHGFRNRRKGSLTGCPFYLFL